MSISPVMSDCEIFLKEVVVSLQPTDPIGWNTCCNKVDVVCNEEKIVKIIIRNNVFKGTLPPAISRLSKLEHLELMFGELSGTIPSSIVELKSLQNLILSNNKLSGTIPNFENMKSLSILKLKNNSFSGPLPPSIGSIPYITVLDLSYNSFNGTIPETFGNFNDLTNLFLSNNQLSKPIPEKVEKMLKKNPQFEIGILKEVTETNTPKLTPSPTSSPNIFTTEINFSMIIVISITAFILIIGLIIIFACSHFSRKKRAIKENLEFEAIKKPSQSDSPNLANIPSKDELVYDPNSPLPSEVTRYSEKRTSSPLVNERITALSQETSQLSQPRTRISQVPPSDIVLPTFESPSPLPTHMYQASLPIPSPIPDFRYDPNEPLPHETPSPVRSLSVRDPNSILPEESISVVGVVRR
ncbi:hypothetical protein BC833DRAFT_608584 [Globomyces pollinis-pini]|nr:hypothetical protein BC833DRAFT_608584 [Globomyces pollinis-pini]